MDKESRYLLQKIDCNCNDCIFLYRNTTKKVEKGSSFPIFYGYCSELKKEVSFQANLCQPQTQHCFLHRLDVLSPEELKEKLQ